MATVAEVFSLAWQHHQAGGYSHAEQLYRQVLQVDPSHADAWCFLGAACQAQGKLTEAETDFRRAVHLFPGHVSAHICLGVLLAQRGQMVDAINSFMAATRSQPDNVEAHNNLGLALARNGQLDEAIESYRFALRLRPDYAVAHYNLGLALNSQHRHDEAVAEFKQALRFHADYPDAFNDMGNALAEQGKLDEATDRYRRSLQLRPQYAEAHFNLAIVLGRQKKDDEALKHFRLAAHHKPDYAEAHLSVGSALRQAGQTSEAMASYRQAMRCRPNWAEPYFNMGWILDEQGKPEEAETYYREAVRRKPEWPEAHHNLGLVRKKQGDLPGSVQHFEQALLLKPDFAEAHYTLGNSLQDLGRMEEATEEFRKAIRCKPEFAMAHNNLGGALLQQGLPDLAVKSFREAIRLEPDLAEAQSNLLFCLNYDPSADPDDVFAEYRRWGLASRERQRPGELVYSYPNDPDPERRLRIGYLSPDFRQHALARYIEPVLANHDPRQVEVICYAEVGRPDPMTSRLQNLAHGWYKTWRQPDDTVVTRIREDRIDILIDLAGHTGNHRLGVFARKPAPIQGTWLGYLNTTGLTTVDYRITDEVLDPPGEPIRDTEELFRLPGGMCCFARPVDAPDVTPLPALKRGYLTFGSLTSLFKLNSMVFDLWSDVLKAVPNSRLLMFRDTLTSTAQAHIRKQFAERGVAEKRLDLRQAPCTHGYLGVYGEMDISLDVYPCTGGVTTCESLWMGVPVISLCGVRPVARNTAAHLSRVGLTDWVVKTAEEFVALGARLPNDLERLAKLRAGLRDRMLSSICDAEKFTRVLEDGFRTMWRRWCAGRASK